MFGEASPTRVRVTGSRSALTPFGLIELMWRRPPGLHGSPPAPRCGVWLVIWVSYAAARPDRRLVCAALRLPAFELASFAL
jgi:hypothetical protein